MTTASAQAAYLVRTWGLPAFLKGPRGSRAVISFDGEYAGLLDSACSRP